MGSSSHRARGSFSIRSNSKAEKFLKRTIFWKRGHLFTSNPQVCTMVILWGFAVGSIQDPYLPWKHQVLLDLLGHKAHVAVQLVQD